MIVKNRLQTKKPRKLPFAPHVRVYVTAALALVLLAGVSLSSVYYGMRLYKDKTADSFATFFENAVATKLNFVPNYLGGYFLAKPERLTVDIKHKHFQRLAHKREVAQQTGLLLTSDADYVPAEIRQGDKILRVKLRLKGDWVDHLQGDKWSFRVKVRGNETLFGMSKFSLHHPKTRNFLHEWLYHQAMRREDFVALRYKFVDVNLNGKALGIYALEEHFDKRLVENSAQREGPLLKFDETVHWLDLAAHGKKGPEKSPTGLQSEEVSPVDTFRAGKIRSNPMLSAELAKATTLLEEFRRRNIGVEDVFDDEKLATFFALSDLMGASHGVGWINLRLYYNPITSRLEPVGFDALGGYSLDKLSGSERSVNGEINRFKELCFSDREFFGKYVSALERVSADGYLERLLDESAEELDENLRILHREFPYYHFSTKAYFDNRKLIRSVIAPPTAIQAFDAGASEEHLAIEVGNIQSLPVEIVGVRASEPLMQYSAMVDLERPVVLDPHVTGNLADYTTVELPRPEGFLWTDSLSVAIDVRWRLYGSNEVRTAALVPWSRRIEGLLEEDLARMPSNYESFPLFQLEESTGTIRVRPGSWVLTEDVVIPEGYRLACGPGVEIDLRNGAAILSRSAIDFHGSEDHPIVIQSSDSTGEGFIVLGAGSRSLMKHTRFWNLSNPSEKGWNITGAVTFYESPVEIDGCEFTDNRCEDGLNIVRSDYTITRSLFQGTKSDAFDSDFSNGTVSFSSFVDCGNDAVDVSGSVIEVANVKVLGAGDKGLSAGERSQMTFKNVIIDRANIGVAAKDQCDVYGTDVSITATNIGYTVFRKKPEFGPANLTVKGSSLVDVKTPHLVEGGSVLTIDGKTIEANRSGLKEALYGKKKVASN